MFKIGEFSRLANVSVRMLRHYDKLELLVPEIVDQDTGYRYYPARQLAQVNKIQRLKGLGFSLATIKQIIEAGDRTEVEAYLSDRKRELHEELEDLIFQSNMLSNALEVVREDTNIMEYSVVLKEIPARHIMALRKTIPSYSDEGVLWEEFGTSMHEHDVRIANPPYAMTVFYDEETKESDFDIEVQISVEDEGRGFGIDSDKDAHEGAGNKSIGDVVFRDEPAVQVASVTFNGPYEQAPHVMEALAAWIEANQYEISGPMFNIAHVSPAQDPDPSNWITESCYEVRKAQQGVEST